MTDDASPPLALAYRGYAQWKGWERLFSCSADEAAYFAGETRDLAVSGADVLEIGFGAGAFLAFARDCGARVVGLEILPELREAAQAAGFELAPEGFEETARLYPARFDTIAAFDVFEHLTAPELGAALDACAALLKPGGKLLLRFPNAQSPFGLAPQQGDPTHRIGLSKAFIEHFLMDRPFAVARYDAAYRIVSGAWSKQAARLARRLAQDAMSFALDLIWAQRIPWHPVVVLVLRKIPEVEA